MALEQFQRQNLSVKGKAQADTSGENIAQGIAEFNAPLLQNAEQKENYEAGLNGHMAAMNGLIPDFDIAKPNEGAQTAFAHSYLAAISQKTSVDWANQSAQWKSQLENSPSRQADWNTISGQMGQYVTNYGKDLPEVAQQQVKEQLALHMTGFEAQAGSLVTQQNKSIAQFNTMQAIGAQNNNAYPLGASNNGKAAQLATQKYTQYNAFAVRSGLLTPAQAVKNINDFKWRIKQGAFTTQYKQAANPKEQQQIITTAINHSDDPVQQGWYVKQASMLNKSVDLNNAVNLANIKKVQRESITSIYSTGEASPVLDQQLNNITTQKQWEAYEESKKDNLNYAQKISDAVNGESGKLSNPIADLPNTIADIRATKTTTPAQDQAKSTALKYANNQLNLLNTDAAKFAEESKIYKMTFGSNAKTAAYQQYIANPINPIENKDAIQTQFMRTMTVQNDMGIPLSKQQVMTNAGARSVVGAYSTLFNENKDVAFNYLANTIQASGTYSYGMIKDLEKNGLSPTAALVAKSYPEVSPYIPDIVNSLNNKNEVAIRYKAKLAEDGTTDADMQGAVNQAMSKYLASYDKVHTLSTNLAGEQSAVSDYAKYLYTTGEVKNINQAATLATNRLINSRYAKIDGNIRIPVQYQNSMGQIHDTIAYQKYNLSQMIKNGDIKQKYSFTAPNASQKITQAQMLQSAHFVSLTDNVIGAVDGDGDLIMTKENKPIEFSLDDVGNEATPEAQALTQNVKKYRENTLSLLDSMISAKGKHIRTLENLKR